jgi:hypothetical protein
VERTRKVAELERRLENLRNYLGCGDPKREETYWAEFKKTSNQLEELRAKPVPQTKVTTADVQQVRDFLSQLPSRWLTYPATIRNRLLKLLIERIDLRHDREKIEARVVWKVGLQQGITIYRPEAKGSRDKRWSADEEKLLTMLWPSCSKEVLEAAFPSRKWSAIKNRAQYLRLKRVGQKTQLGGRRCHWLPEEEAKAEALYEAGAPLPDMVAELGRSRGAILNRAAEKRWRRPPSAKWKKGEVTWEVQDFKLSQAEPCAMEHAPSCPVLEESIDKR